MYVVVANNNADGIYNVNIIYLQRVRRGEAGRDGRRRSSPGVGPPADRFGEHRSMTPYETYREERTAVRRGLIGLDAEGDVHEIDPTTRTVYVRDHSGVDHVEELGERAVEEWVAYVREERGWDDLRYSDAGIVAAVVDGLTGDGDADDQEQELVTDGGRPRDDGARTCARCDDSAEPGSRFCADHGRVVTDGGVASRRVPRGTTVRVPHYPDYKQPYTVRCQFHSGDYELSSTHNEPLIGIEREDFVVVDGEVADE